MKKERAAAGRGGGNVRVRDDILELSDAELRVYLGLLLLADENDRFTGSQRSLAKALNASLSRVNKGLKSLCSRGWVLHRKWYEQSFPDSGTTRQFRFNHPCYEIRNGNPQNCGLLLRNQEREPAELSTLVPESTTAAVAARNSRPEPLEETVNRLASTYPGPVIEPLEQLVRQMRSRPEIGCDGPEADQLFVERMIADLPRYAKHWESEKQTPRKLYWFIKDYNPRAKFRDDTRSAFNDAGVRSRLRKEMYGDDVREAS